MGTTKALVILGGCTGLSESSLGARGVRLAPVFQCWAGFLSSPHLGLKQVFIFNLYVFCDTS